jgi:hypothetical protein
LKTNHLATLLDKVFHSFFKAAAKTKEAVLKGLNFQLFLSRFPFTSEIFFPPFLLLSRVSGKRHKSYSSLSSILQKLTKIAKK